MLAGLTQGVSLSANFSLTITQASGVLSGSWSIVGTLDVLDACNAFLRYDSTILLAR